MGDVTVTITDPLEPESNTTDNHIEQLVVSAIDNASDALETAQSAQQTTTEIADAVSDQNEQILDRLEKMSERLDKLETKPEIPEDTRDSPVVEPALLKTPNSPAEQVPVNDANNNDSNITVDNNTASGNIVDNVDNDTSSKTNNTAGSSENTRTNRKRDKAPKQKLGWRGVILGGSGGKR